MIHRRGETKTRKKLHSSCDSGVVAHWRRKTEEWRIRGQPERIVYRALAKKSYQGSRVSWAVMAPASLGACRSNGTSRRSASGLSLGAGRACRETPGSARLRSGIVLNTTSAKMMGIKISDAVLARPPDLEICRKYPVTLHSDVQCRSQLRRRDCPARLVRRRAENRRHASIGLA